VTRRVALALAGGIGLGAFEVGAWEALEEAGLRPDWILGTSIGAVSAVLIAGGPPEGATARLRRFWETVGFEPLPAAGFWLGPVPPSGPLRRAAADAAISQTLVLGRSGLFRPNPRPSEAAPALYELDPLRRTLAELVDFDALRAPGAPRLTLTASDLLAGERVVFDTGRGDRIAPETIVACCALTPIFPPVELGGRLLGDGGLTGNLPLEPALSEPGAEEVLCIAVELFARQGARPRSLSTAAARAADVVFGSRTRDAVLAERRAHALRGALRRLSAGSPAPAEAALADGPETVTVLLVGERAEPDEAGLLKPFDFSRATLAARRQAGAAATRAALGHPRAARGEFRVAEVTGPIDTYGELTGGMMHPVG
jgi:NTE family protein